jgi:hypothetical protein
MKMNLINPGRIALVMFAFIFFLVSCEKEDMGKDLKDNKSKSDPVSLTASDPVESSPESDGEIVPVIISGANNGGNRTCAEVAAAFETTFNYSTGKIDYEDGEFLGDWPDGLTVTTDGTYITFSLDDPFKIDGKCYLVGAVIAKGGNNANIYYYQDGTSGDSGLASPINASGKPADLSNLTFCFIEVECPINGECQYETAYGGGTAGENEGTGKGGWWYYYDARINAGGVQTVWAGQHINVGTVEVVEGEVTIILNNGWELQPWKTDKGVLVYDGDGKLIPENESVKILGTNTLPSSRPAGGSFPLKGTSLDITVDDYDYYIIHLDVQKCR